MRTAALLFTVLLALVTSPLAAAGEGHEEPAAADHDAAGVSGPEMQPGEAWSFNVTEEGTFDYHCHPHPWMLGQLRVLPANGTATMHTINVTEPPGEDFEKWTFAPKTYDVRVGDTVTWINAGSVMHRVTQTVGEHIAHVGTLGGEAEHDEGEVHAEDASAQAARPSGLWWMAVAGLGVVCVGLFVKGGKKAP